VTILDLPGGWVAFYADTGEELGRVHPPDRGFSVEQLNELYEEQGWTLVELAQFAEHMRKRDLERARLRAELTARA